MKKYTLLNFGLFPETLPPCFTSHRAQRAFSGMTRALDRKAYSRRPTKYIRYSSTKHDGSRRFFGTANIISYYFISDFISKNLKEFENKFRQSNFAIASPEVMVDGPERAVKVPSLSELSRVASHKISYAPFLLKVDISQYFPSIYTHSIPWAAHGVEQSKGDVKRDSASNNFNRLDYFIQQCQSSQTRGVLIGPDAFRLVAEFISSDLDRRIEERLQNKIVGAARHVDDYYIGVSSEVEALSALSIVREVLSKFELQLNDSKTRIQSSLDPINDLWAQRLRHRLHSVSIFNFGNIEETFSSLELALNEARETSIEIGSDSPIKMAIRMIDDRDLYKDPYWSIVEPYLQRCVSAHTHALDYVFLILLKRYALGLTLDEGAWLEVIKGCVTRALALNHHHEAIWGLWISFSLALKLPKEIIDECAQHTNDHIKAIVVQAFADGKIGWKPKFGFRSRLSTDDENWLSNLTARTFGVSGAPFGGIHSAEFDHLARKKLRLIDFKAPLARLRKSDVSAISRTRYGYDDDEEDSSDYDVDWDALMDMD